MLTSMHRYLIRVGLSLFAAASFATVAVLAHEYLAPVVATSDRAVAESVVADDPAASADNSSSVERARGQLASMVRPSGSPYATMALDWTGLTFDVDLLRETTPADLALASIGIIEPAPAVDWPALSPQSAQAEYGGGMGAAAFAGVSAGGGGGAAGGSGGAGGGSGGGGSAGASGGAPGSNAAGSGSMGVSGTALPVGLTALFGPQDAAGLASLNGNGKQPPGLNGGLPPGQDRSFNASSESNGAQQSNGRGRAGGASVVALQVEGGAVTVPEPSTLMLAAVGLFSLIASRSRRRES